MKTTAYFEAFRPWVAALSDSLDQRVAAYRRRTSKSLSSDEFRARFLWEAAIRELSFLLSYYVIGMFYEGHGGTHFHAVLEDGDPRLESESVGTQAVDVA